MKNATKIIFISAFAMFGLQSTSYAATSSATASATVLSPVAVTKSSDLDFGKIISGASAATVTLTGTGGFNCGAGLTCTGTHNAAAFGITGSNNETVTVATDSAVNLQSGSNSMSATLAPSSSSLTLTGGVASFNVGGALSVAANQPAGAYAGSFNVTVNYQ